MINCTDELRSLDLAIIGCGKLGTAVLIGILKAQSVNPKPRQINVVVTVRSYQSKKHLEAVLHEFGADYASPKCAISVSLHDVNPIAASQANVIILACKPSVSEIICGEGKFQHALTSSPQKILVSLVGGTSCSNIEAALHGESDEVGNFPFTLVRAIPNIAAQIRQSITSLALPDKHDYAPEEIRAATMTVTEIFDMVGTTKWVPEVAMHVTSTIGASALALFAAFIDQVAQSAYTSTNSVSAETVAEITAQAAHGAAGLVLNGMSAHRIIQQVATKGGSTQAGLDVLSGQKVPLAIHSAVKATIAATQQLSESVSRP